MGNSRTFDFGGFSKDTGPSEADHTDKQGLLSETGLGGKKPRGAGELQYGQGPGKFARRVDADDNGYGKQSTHGKSKRK